MQKILIAEDDETIRRELKTFLNKNGYEAEALESFEHPVEDLLARKPDLILLDINLPLTDGEYICKEIRKTSDVPIIMVTSRDSELDELICLNYGADQYVTKPYNIQILLAKIAGLLKRSQGSAAPDTVTLSRFTLSISGRYIEQGGARRELTKNEFTILYYLSLHRGAVVPREELMDYLWESESFIDDNTLSVNMKRLRDKLQDIGAEGSIETKRGQGYRLE
ncbi:MAG: response regulator transcription factor [Eubacteriales bacterium]|nr:response regulator transcription factor [Eubacteriales bacterium]